MPQIAVPSASTIVKTAALIMAVPTLLLPMKAAAQQMALGGPNFVACEQIKDPAKSAQCTRDATMENLRQRNEAALARIREADARSAAAAARTACANEIGELRRNSVFGDKATEIARELVKASGRPAIEYDSCTLRDGIRAGLTRMKLLPARVSLN